MEHFDTLVIGGGPAGLIAAGRAAELGERVLLVEKNDSLGTKLLLAGRGRCNITNAEPDMNLFLKHYGENGRFLHGAFSRFGPSETIAFFNRNGVQTITERGKRVFPLIKHSSNISGGQQVLNSLLTYCKKGNVRILRSSPVSTFIVKNDRIERIVTKREELSADRYILATGGKSYPKTGSTGDGYNFARLAGHTIVEPTPAIVPVKTHETWVKLARNFNLRHVRLTAMLNGDTVAERMGDMEFTNFGVSGPIVMELSGRISDWMKQGTVHLVIDLKPALDLSVLCARIERDFIKYQNREFSQALGDLLPSTLVPMILELSDIPSEKPVLYISQEEREDLAHLLKNITLTVNGLWSFNHAIVTKGGVSLKEIDPVTLRSKICDNLYFAGEILDLNGPSGGFNLQICWSTGYIAGSHIQDLKLSS